MKIVTSIANKRMVPSKFLKIPSFEESILEFNLLFH